MQQNWKFQRGDIFFTHFGASTGSEQHGDRPAVILQNDVGNYHSPTLIVATMTSKAEKKVNQPTHCLLENAGLNMPSVVQAEQIFTIDKSRALKYLGHLTPEMIRSIRTLCGVCLCSFVESKAFKIAIVPSADRSMDTCTVCQTRRGHDYVVMKR